MKEPSPSLTTYVRYGYRTALAFEGRATRRSVFAILLWIVLGIAVSEPMLAYTGPWAKWILALYAAPLPALIVRRMRDIGWFPHLAFGLLWPPSACAVLAAAIVMPPRRETAEDRLFLYGMKAMPGMDFLWDGPDPRRNEGYALLPKLS